VGPPPEAAVGPPPEAAVGPPPEAAVGPPPEAAVGPPPEAAAGPPPEAAAGLPPEAAAGPPPEAAAGPPPEAARPSALAAANYRSSVGQEGQRSLPATARAVRSGRQPTALERASAACTTRIRQSSNCPSRNVDKASESQLLPQHPKQPGRPPRYCLRAGVRRRASSPNACPLPHILPNNDHSLRTSVSPAESPAPTRGRI